MGVPKFYRWISERYPCLSEVIKDYQIPEFDNLYLDMNGIIHVCSHPNDDDPHFRISEEKIFADICHYIDFLFKMIQPRKVFFMAIDGVAPRAKMNQQRGRRFRTAKSALLLEQKAKELGQDLPTEARFDSNCITPGTEFMCKLQDILKNFVAFKISTDKLWQNVRVYLSGHETPGEGEHKIMDFIRYEKSQDNYDSNTRHCLYGLDADLIMLGLCSHEPYFSLLREEVRFGKKENQKRIVTPEETTFHLLHLSLLREYLGHEFGAVKESIDFDFDLESVIDDFVLMSFLVGNDFIPHLPQLHIRHNALPILFKTYIEVLPSLGGYINEMGDLNLERFEKFFEKLSEFDYEKFGESSNFPVPGSKPRDDFEENDTGIDDSLEKLAKLGFSEQSVSKTNEYDSSTDNDDDNAASFELEFSQHKMDYYRSKLEYDSITAEELQDQAEGYVRAIQWNLHYYYNGIASWSWYYPHHYAPYISDVKNFKNMEMNFELGDPFTPFQQLLAVLPVQSKALLPKSYQELMCDVNSPLRDCYPEDFKTDLNGKQQEWEAVVLIPFINESLLLKCAREADKKLTPEEKSRNKHGPHLLYTFTEKNSGNKPSFLPLYFPPLNEDHSKCQLLDKDFFRLPRDQLRKGLCEGVSLDVYTKGFPTLKHVKHTANLSKEEVKVFQMITQRESMMLRITEIVDDDIEKVANSLLGKVVCVGWPHLEQGFVESVSSEEITYVYKSGKHVKTVTNSNVWLCQAKSFSTHYYRRLGIFVGEVHILVHAKCFRGSKLVCTSEGKVVEHKQWTESTSDYALQVVKDISMRAPKLSSKSYKELYPNGSVVFMLGQPNYGCMGTVVNNDVKKNRGCMHVSFEFTREPDLSTVISNKDNLVSQSYMPGYVLAQRLGINSYLVSRLTGSYLIQTSSRESISPNKVNVGLNLKFNKKNEEVAGFTKKTEDNQWLYSQQALDTLDKYLHEFPEFFDRLIPFSNQDITYLEDMYPDGSGKEIIHKVTEWLKAQQCSSADRQLCGLNSLDEGIISAIESTVGKVSKEGKPVTKIFPVNPELLYSPFNCKGCVIPDPAAVFYLFDRVINVRHNLTVPLGYCGTVIAIRGADRQCDYIYEVLFDREFFGCMKLHSAGKCYRMPPSSLINISHGDRLNSRTRSPKKASSNSRDRKSTDVSNLTHSPKKSNHNEKLNFDEHKNQGRKSSSSFPPPPMQLLKRNSGQLQSNQPFYKADTASTKHSADEILCSPVSKLMNSSENQFVMPVATSVPNRNSLRNQRATTQSAQKSDYEMMWSQMKTTKTRSSPSSSNDKIEPPAIQRGKSVMEELFGASVAIKNKPEIPYYSKSFPPPPVTAIPPPACVSSAKRSVVDLMNLCLQMYNSPPTYTYKVLALTNWFVATVKLPDGRTHSGAQCPSEEEAAENVAEHVLATVFQTKNRSNNHIKQDNIYPPYPGVGASPYDIYYSSAPFRSLGVDLSARLPTPAPFPTPVQYPSPLRHPAILTPAIPESFVKQNELMISGQITPEQLLMGYGHTPSAADHHEFPVHAFKKIVKPSAAREDQAKKSSSSVNMFVPSQVLRNSAKKGVLPDSEWPTLQSAADSGKGPRQKTPSSALHKNDSMSVVNPETTGSSELKETVPNLPDVPSFKKAAEVLSTPKKSSRKNRIAAFIPNIS